MTTFNNIPLPPDLQRGLMNVVDGMPEATLRKLPLKGSFTKASAIRKRLREIIESNTPLPDWLGQSLTEAMPQREAVAVLDPRFIKSFHRELAAVLTREHLLLLLISDEREEVREYGRALIEADPARITAGECSAEEARARLLHLIGSHYVEPLELLPSSEDGSGQDQDSATKAQPAAGDIGAPAQAQEKVRKLETEIANQRRFASDARRRFKAEIHDLSNELAAARKELDARVTRMTETVSGAQGRVQELEGELKESLQATEARVESEVATRISALRRKWLAEPIAMEQAVNESSTPVENLLERAQRALLAQQQLDRHSGNRITLQERLTRLTRAHEQVVQTLQAALTPHQDLAVIGRELEAEIASLKRTLGMDQPGAPWTDRLLERINLSTDIAALERIDLLIATLFDNELLAPADRSRLYRAFMRKHGLLGEMEDPRDRGRSSLHGWSIRDLILSNSDILLLIDGHNVLGVDGRLELKPGEAVSEAMTRLQLSVCELVRDRRRVEGRLYFDSASPGTTTLIPNLRVDYSGGTGENRADNRIIADLRFKKAEDPARPVFVVTDDRVIRQEALTLGATYVAVPIFVGLLEDSG